MESELLSRFGGDLLSHTLRCSTIGATALNCRVREGIGCFARAMTTKPRKKLQHQCAADGGVTRCMPQPLCCDADRVSDQMSQRVFPSLSRHFHVSVLLLTIQSVVLANLAVSGSNQAYRAISTSQLKALPLLHLWPIDVVVFHGSQGRPCFEGGFPLRCLQRLSCPNIATQHYRWHDNWSTSGSFTPVLSY